MKKDPYADEPTAEVDPDISRLHLEACISVKLWTDEMNRLKALINEQIGDAHAGLVNGRKLYTHRPIDNYAVARMCKENPDLTQHYWTVQAQEVFDVDTFALAHPEILERYRSRQFKSIGEVATS